MQLFRKSSTTSLNQRDTFKSIHDLPIARWNKINSTGDYGFLFKTKKEDNEKDFTIEELQAVWEVIFDEYISEFGLSEDYKDHLRSLTHLTIMKCEQVIEFEGIRDAEINILENEMNAQSEDNENTFGKTLIMVGKFTGYRIDPEICTVFEFNSALALMKQQFKEAS